MTIKGYWRSLPVLLRGLVLLVLTLAVLSAVMPSPKERAKKQFQWKPRSIYEALLEAGAIQTHRTRIRPSDPHPLFTVVLVWDAGLPPTGTWTFVEDQIQGCDVWEFPVNGEKSHTAIRAIDWYTLSDPILSKFDGRYRLFGGSAANFPPVKRTAAQTKAAKAKAAELTKNFLARGLPAPAIPTAYIMIPGEKDVVVIENGKDLHKLRKVFYPD